MFLSSQLFFNRKEIRFYINHFNFKLKQITLLLTSTIIYPPRINQSIASPYYAYITLSMTFHLDLHQISTKIYYNKEHFRVYYTCMSTRNSMEVERQYQQIFYNNFINTLEHFIPYLV